MLVAGVVVLMVLAGGAVGAGADPVNAKKGEIIELECDNGLGALTVALNGNGEYTPGHVIGSTQVGIPYAFHFESSFTPTGGETQTDVEDLAKPGPKNGRLATCTFHLEEQNDEGLFVLDGIVSISYTKAR